MSDQGADLEGEQPVETTGEVVEAEESATSETPEDTSAQPEAPKEPKGVQKRINELTANWREEQRQKQQLLDQNLELQRRLTPEAPTSQPESEPKPEDFSTYEEFVDARATFRAEQTATAKLDEWKQEQDKTTQANTQAEHQREFDVRADAFAATHDDFDEVARNPSLPVTQDMADLLNVSEKGPELLYHLGQNPGEAYRLAQLPPTQAAMELGRIEAQLGVLQPNTQTDAPAPIEPISGGTGSQTKDPDQMSMTEWTAWRNGQLEKKA